MGSKERISGSQFLNHTTLMETYLTSFRKSAILARENQLLREQLNSVYAHGEQKSSASPSDAITSHSPRSPMSGRESHDPRVHLPDPDITREPLPPAAPPIDIGTTLPRSLDDVMLAYTEIDELFALYVCSLNRD